VFFAFFVIVFAAGALPAWAETRASAQAENVDSGRGYGFAISTGLGFLFGTSYEIVYQYTGEKDYLSELQWNIKPLLFMGINLDFGLKNPMKKPGFFAGLGFKSALPMETGIMEDRDWMQPSTVPGALTHFSSHENHTRAALFVNHDAGLSLPLRKLVLKFHFNLDYMYFKWEALNGYTQYDPADSYPSIPWNSGFPKIPFSGTGIRYTQHWFLLSTGAGAEFPLGRFTFSASVIIGLSNCIATDEHLSRDPPFKTTAYLSNGFAIKPKMGTFFSLSNRFDLGLFFGYLYIGETRGGSLFEDTNGVQYFILDIEGARLKVFEGNLLLRYRF
jgi:outer membrane protease